MLPVAAELVRRGNVVRFYSFDEFEKKIKATGAEFITGPDSSCLMHMQGIAAKQKFPIKFIHVAQILSAGL